MSAVAAPPAGPPAMRTIWGHPRPLATFFLTEMWERFSFYGMRALLVLYLAAGPAQGGLGYSVGEAAQVYALYNALVYVTPLAGGWIADRLLGPRTTVLIGGAVIAAGHATLALGGGPALYPALGLIIVGTGLLKPNLSTMVGELYAGRDDLRDAGFSIYYMGINLGAFIAPLICGYLGQEVGWDYGFGAAAIGMVVALVQYVLGFRGLGAIGRDPGTPLPHDRRRALAVAAAAGAALVAAVVAGGIAAGVPAEAWETVLTLLILAIPTVWFGRRLRAPGVPVEEGRRLRALLLLFVVSAAFWLAYDQAGSTLSIFAQQNTRLDVLGESFPASWFQSVNPILILAFAPVLAGLWTWLGPRQPGTGWKFSLGIGLVTVSMGIMVLAAVAAEGGTRVSPAWLCLVYLVQTLGELCLSPVGLAAATRLAPAGRGAQTMGVWFLSTSVGDAIGGRLAGLYGELGQAGYFAMLGGIAAAATILMVVTARPVGRLMRGEAWRAPG